MRRERFLLARSWSATADYRFGLMLALHNLSVVYFHTGRFDLSISAAHDVGQLNREIKYPGWAYPWTRAIVSQISGDRTSAREAINDLRTLDPPAGSRRARRWRWRPNWRWTRRTSTKPSGPLWLRGWRRSASATRWCGRWCCS